MTMIKLLHYLSYFALTVVGLILLYLAAAYCLSRITVDKEPNTKEEVAVYIKTNGVHTDIVVPVRHPQMDWSREVKFAHTISADSSAQYVGLGWGDKGFYLETPTWADLRASVAFKAGFALGTTAIHATFYDEMVEDESCKKIMISNEQYSRLIKYISNSFQKDKNGHFIPIKTTANYGNTDAFYEANGSFSIFRTCNTWTNNSLKSCGQKACLWTPFDTGIFLKYSD